MTSGYTTIVDAPQSLALTSGQLKRLIDASTPPKNKTEQWRWVWEPRPRTLQLFRMSVRDPVYEIQLDESLTTIQEVRVLDKLDLYRRPEPRQYEIEVLKWHLVAMILGESQPFPIPKAKKASS